MRSIRLAAVIAVATISVAACGSSKKTTSPAPAASGGPSATGASTSPSAAATTGGSGGGGGKAGSKVKVGLAFDIGGKGDKSFNDAADRGLTMAEQQLGVSGKELSPNKDASNRADNLTLLAQAGYNPVIGVGFSYADPIKTVAAQFPKTTFIVIDSVVPSPNVRSLTFAANESSYLVGAAAAMASKHHHIGYVEALKIDLLENFRAGYEAGARSVDPKIKIEVGVTNDNTFSDAAKARETANGEIDKGADVIYQVAGGSGSGVFQAAAARKVLAIGVDSDQYLGVTDAAQKAVILTSALKRVDTGVFDSIQEFIAKGSLSGTKNFDLKINGVGYSTSNPIFAPYAARVAAIAAKITSGSVTVPAKPSD